MNGKRLARRPALSRVLNSTLTEAATLCLELRGFLLSQGLTPVAFAVELVARELLDNAITHGNRGLADKKVEFRLWVKPARVTMQVSDEGEGFNWRLQPRSPGDAVGPSGRGLGLCFAYADRVRFNARGNRVTLCFRTSQQPSTGSGGGSNDPLCD